MVLRTLRDVGLNRCVVYEDESGDVVGTSESVPCGSTGFLGGQRTATYVNEDYHLILQIGCDTFDLDSHETKAYGRNDYETNTASFRIVQGERQRHLCYPGWWTAWDFGQGEVMARAELAEFEDEMGWVWRVLSDPKAREDKKQHLLKLPCSSQSTSDAH